MEAEFKQFKTKIGQGLGQLDLSIEEVFKSQEVGRMYQKEQEITIQNVKKAVDLAYETQSFQQQESETKFQSMEL